MIGRRRLEPDDPPPDLAIETDVTSKTTLDAYEAIAVPELWIYDSGKLTIYSKRQTAPGLLCRREKLDESWFQYLARVKSCLGDCYICSEMESTSNVTPVLSFQISL